MSLRQEKPHKFFAQNIAQILESLNYIASFPQNRLYLRLMVPRGGLAVGRNEMPDLPSFQRQILLDAQRRDIEPYIEAIVAEHETAFAVNGAQVTSFKVSRKTEY